MYYNRNKNRNENKDNNIRGVSTQKKGSRFQELYNRYRDLYQDIKAAQEQVLFLKEITEYKSPSLVGTGGSGDCNDRVGKNASKIVDLKRSIGEKQALMLELWEELSAMIATLGSSTQRRIMTERYINQKKWERIAEDVNMCERWVYKLHKRALEELQ